MKRSRKLALLLALVMVSALLFPLTLAVAHYDVGGYGEGVVEEAPEPVSEPAPPVAPQPFDDTTNQTGDTTVTQVAVQSVSISGTTALTLGTTTQLTATVVPANATNVSITWGSDNAAVASVNQNGVVTANTLGSARITATAYSGRSATVIVTVIAPATVWQGQHSCCHRWWDGVQWRYRNQWHGHRWWDGARWRYDSGRWWDGSQWRYDSFRYRWWGGFAWRYDSRWHGDYWWDGHRWQYGGRRWWDGTTWRSDIQWNNNRWWDGFNWRYDSSHRWWDGSRWRYDWQGQRWWDGTRWRYDDVQWNNNRWWDGFNWRYDSRWDSGGRWWDGVRWRYDWWDQPVRTVHGGSPTSAVAAPPIAQAEESEPYEPEEPEVDDAPAPGDEELGMGGALVGAGVSLRFTIGSIFMRGEGLMVALEAAPFIDADTNRTMIPLRGIAEGLGAGIDWDIATRVARIERDGTVIHLSADEPLPGGMGTPMVVEGRIFVPLRYVSEIFGETVRWDAESLAVYVN